MHRESQPDDRRPAEPGGGPRGREAVEEALLAAATDLFAVHGVQGASVRDIAAAAGVNHALVFRHFGSKARLLRAVLDRLLDDLLASFRSAGLDARSLAAVGEGIAGREALWKLLTRAVLDGDVDFLVERRFPEIDRTLAAVGRACEAGVVRHDGDPRQLLAVVLSGAVGWALLDPILAETVGIPGATPRRRRELARAAFGELMGIAPPGSASLSAEEARKAAVPDVLPRIDGGAKPLRRRGVVPASGPPRGREQVVWALIDAAMELFALRGPAAVSVREVAARARVNHALVFRHFGSKEGLVQAVWERVVQDLAGRVVGIPDYPGLVAVTEALAESERIWKLLARAILDGQAATIAGYHYRFLDAMVWAAARGQQVGVLEARMHPRLLVGMGIATGFGWLIFHPVLVPLLGIPRRSDADLRAALRDEVAAMLGWRGSRDATPRAH